MTRFRSTIFLLCMAAAPVNQALAENDSLQVMSLSGKAPFTAYITGPARLLKLANGRFYKRGGCGFIIEWRDKANSRTPVGPLDSDCFAALEHTYTSPGIYSVKATIFHTDANDEPVTDWTGFAAVKVEE